MIARLQWKRTSSRNTGRCLQLLSIKCSVKQYDFLRPSDRFRHARCVPLIPDTSRFPMIHIPASPRQSTALVTYLLSRIVGTVRRVCVFASRQSDITIANERILIRIWRPQIEIISDKSSLSSLWSKHYLLSDVFLCYNTSTPNHIHAQPGPPTPLWPTARATR